MDRLSLDANVLFSAACGNPSHLLTGDRKDFGPTFRKRIAGTLILPPAEYP